MSRLLLAFITSLFVFINVKAQLTHSGNFVHLGGVENNEELAFVKDKIDNDKQPWAGQFNDLLGWAVAGNLNAVGDGENGPRDLAKNAYANALAWHYTGNTTYADRAVNILNAWAGFGGYSSTAGQDLLVGGWLGTLLGPAAELMRDYSGWPATEQNDLKTMFEKEFYPVINTMSRWNGNVDLTQIQAMLAIAVFNEDVDEFNAGLARLELRNPAYYYLSTDAPSSRNYGGSSEANWGESNGEGSAVTDWVDGLTQETCRDNGHHAQFAMAATLAAAEIAWHQGVDVYAREEERYVAVLELMALQLTSGNMQGTCEDNVTSTSRFNTFEIGYNHYHNRMGLDLPETAKVLPISANSADSWNIFFETLTHRGVGGSGVSLCTRPNLGKNLSICGNKSLTLNSGLNTVGKTIVWTKNGDVIPGEDGASLVIEEAGEYVIEADSARCVTTDKITVGGTISVDLGPDVELCAATTEILDAGTEGTDYLWSTGEITRTIEVMEVGTYSVAVSIAGCPEATDEITVTSKLLEVTAEPICTSGTVNLIVEDNGTFSWFDSPTSTVSLEEGNTYSPIITANTTFYVEDEGGVDGTLGKENAGTGETWSTLSTDFAAADKVNNVTVSQTITLNSIAVYVNGSASVTINFKQGGVPVHTKTIPNLGGGKQTLDLGFVLEPGNYVIDVEGTTGELFFEASGATFPYSYPEFISFTYNQNWQAEWYGWFYDWNITAGNTCTRTPVIAVIDSKNQDCVVNGLKDFDQHILSVYPNPSQNGVFKLGKSSSWEVFTSLGQSIKAGQGTEVDISNELKGLYIIRTENGIAKIIFD